MHTATIAAVTPDHYIPSRSRSAINAAATVAMAFKIGVPVYSAEANAGVTVGSREGIRMLNVALLKSIGHFAEEREFGDSIADHSAEALAEVDQLINSLIPADAAEPEDVRDAIVHFGDWAAKRFLNCEWRRITALADWLEDRQVTLSGDDARAIYDASR